jgi:hypothetical protein
MLTVLGGPVPGRAKTPLVACPPVRRSVATVALAALLTAVPASAADPISEIPAAATATGIAYRTFLGTDLVSVSQSSTMTPDKIALAKQAAAAAGASSTELSGYSFGMAWVRRGDVVVQQYAGSGLWQYPMSTTVIPPENLPALMGTDVAAAVAHGFVAMGETTANLRGARAGDTIGLVSAGGTVLPFSIGVVVPDAFVGGAEIVMSPLMAETLGVDDVTSVLVYGTFSRFRIEQELNARGLVDGTDVRIRRSWDLPNPDSVLGLLRTKLLLGEFAYKLVDTVNGVHIEPEWVARSLPEDRTQYADIPVRARCHHAISGALQRALTEIAQSGLAWAIDVGNTNTFGGCYNPRFNRLTGNLGFLSRHAWGQAFDTNTLTNAQGRVPRMDCRVVRIFRKHGFAWGGNFLTPDGMHFEYVGEPRHELQYPSEYCPNVPGGGIESSPIASDGRAWFFDIDPESLLSVHAHP